MVLTIAFYCLGHFKNGYDDDDDDDDTMTETNGQNGQGHSLIATLRSSPANTSGDTTSKCTHTDLASTSAEARLALALLHAFVLPVHQGTAVAAVQARVRVAPTRHVRVLPVCATYTSTVLARGICI